MATKGKGRVLDGQIAFEFFGELEQTIKPRRQKTTESKKANTINKFFKRKNLNLKSNHLKKHRKVRKFSKGR